MSYINKKTSTNINTFYEFKQFLGKTTWNIVMRDRKLYDPVRLRNYKLILSRILWHIILKLIIRLFLLFFFKLNERNTLPYTKSALKVFLESIDDHYRCVSLTLNAEVSALLQFHQACGAIER